MSTGEHLVRVETLGSPTFPSPLRLAAEPGTGLPRFVSDEAWVRHRVEVSRGGAGEPAEDLLFEKAGPRARLYFEPSATRAAVVTCGGLCPGLNSVIRSLFLELHFGYGVQEVFGIRNGYMGLDPSNGRAPLRLSCECVSGINLQGGTILGSSRGQQDLGRMVDFLENERISLLFCIGGDGTQRGSHALAEEVRRRGRKLSVVGIPKTIDNDLGYCTRTFGYTTAVEHARQVIDRAHTEATGALRGIGLVKLMGRDAGFIACGATLACQDVNFTLIPEVPFRLEGEGGLLADLERRMDEREHAVIVVSEGAGQHLFNVQAEGADASGNRRYHDIGPFLKERIVAHFRAIGKPIDLKYIDPSYIIRSTAANTEDSVLCDQLARRAVHAAMSGRTDLVVVRLNRSFAHVPIGLAVETKRRVDPEGELWAAVLAVTGQSPGLGG
jgi:6-phosphofructokinase 1